MMQKQRRQAGNAAVLYCFPVNPERIRPCSRKFPYGESHFKTVISEGYAYLDKTAYIPPLEAAGKYLFLLRPRRFGKSLFLSMLEHYYDVKYREEFDDLFGKLYVGQHPTPLRNSYQVLFMDFSGIDTDGGHDENIASDYGKIMGMFTT